MWVFNWESLRNSMSRMYPTSHPTSTGISWPPIQTPHIAAEAHFEMLWEAERRMQAGLESCPGILVLIVSSVWAKSAGCDSRPLASTHWPLGLASTPLTCPSRTSTITPFSKSLQKEWGSMSRCPSRRDGSWQFWTVELVNSEHRLLVVVIWVYFLILDSFGLTFTLYCLGFALCCIL